MSIVILLNKFKNILCGMEYLKCQNFIMLKEKCEFKKKSHLCYIKLLNNTQIWT